MFAQYAIAPIVLATSAVSLVVYSLALASMLRGAPPPGVVRTGTCRVVSAVLYIGVGVLSLRSVPNGAMAGLGVYVTMWLVWQGNAIADASLSRQRARHARRPATAYQDPGSPATVNGGPPGRTIPPPH